MINKAIEKCISITGSQYALGKATKTAQSSVWKWLHNKAKPSPQKVLLIVKATKGQVNASEIRPDLPDLFPVRKKATKSN
ncbi:YdaS family helix-turn-helix protein [Orbus sturtevantii]|uniref:transcriptional regulator n=1 Tax=Orbus sturtevantii TaxID=3074109 RepID=UPI00370D9D95